MCEGVKFREHCINNSRDILYLVYCHFSCEPHDVITSLICHYSALCKAFKIYSDYSSCHTNFKNVYRLHNSLLPLQYTLTRNGVFPKIQLSIHKLLFLYWETLMTNYQYLQSDLIHQVGPWLATVPLYLEKGCGEWRDTKTLACVEISQHNPAEENILGKQKLRNEILYRKPQL